MYVYRCVRLCVCACVFAAWNEVAIFPRFLPNRMALFTASPFQAFFSDFYFLLLSKSFVRMQENEIFFV